MNYYDDTKLSKEDKKTYYSNLLQSELITKCEYERLMSEMKKGA